MGRAKSADINFWWETFHSAHSHLAGIISNLAFVVVLSRFLPIEEVGLYFFYLAAAYVLFQPLKGIGTAVRKRVSSINSGREEYLVGSIALIIPALVISLGITIAVALLVRSYIPFEITTLGLLGLVVCVTGDGVRSVGYQYLSGCGQPARASQLRNYVSNILKLGGTVLVLSYFPTFESALFTQGVTYGVIGIGCWYIAPSSESGEKKLVSRPSYEQIRELFDFSKWSVPNMLLNDFYHRFDTLVLGVMVGSVAISYYDAPVRLSSLGGVVGWAIAGTVNVKLSGLYENEEEFILLAKKAVAGSTLLAYPVLIIAIVFPELILEVAFGEEYIPAKWFLIGLCVQQLLNLSRSPLEAVFNAVDSPNRITKASITSVVINGVTAIPLVLALGGVGVVVSSIISDTARLLVFQRESQKELGELILHKFMYKQVLAAIVVSAVLFIINQYVTLASVFHLVGISFLVLLLFYSILYVSSDIPKEIITDIKNGVSLFD